MSLSRIGGPRPSWAFTPARQAGNTIYRVDVRCPKLVGREPELIVLRQLVDNVATGDGRALVVRGVGGVGKTALAKLVVELAEASGCRGLLGRSAPDATVPFRSLTEVALAAMAEGADIDEPSLRLFKPALLAMIGDKPINGDPLSDSGTNAAHPLLVAEAILRVASSLVEPAVVVIEDVHWADPDTLATFEYMCDHGPDRGLGIVATLRSDEPHDALQLIDRLSERRSITVLDLAPLDRRSVNTMVELCLAEQPTTGLIDTIMARSEGRPLVIEELLTAVATLSPEDSGGVDIIPASLLDSVARRMAGIPTAQRRVIVLAAQLGIEVPLSILGRLSEQPQPDLMVTMLAAERAFLGAVDGKSYVFHHGLTRDAVLGATPAPERRLVAVAGLRLLGEANVLDDVELDAAAALAVHAGETEQAARFHLVSGRRALARGALRLATGSLRTAQAGAGLDYELRAEASGTLVEVLAQSGQVAEALREGTAALRMAQSQANVKAERRIRLALIRADIAAERWAEALDRLDELGAGVDDDDLQPAELSLRAFAEMGAGRFEDARTTAAAVVHDPDTGAAEAPAVCEALEVLGRIARSRDLEEAASWFEQGVRIAEKARLASWRARALHELATIRQLDAGLVDQHDVALTAALDAGALGVATAVLFHLGAVHGVQFDAEKGLDEGRRCLELARRLGTPRQEAFAWIIIGQAHAVAGRESRARAAATEARKLAPDDLEINALAGGSCIGLALLLNERRAEAVEELDAAVSLLEQLPTKSPIGVWYLWPILASVERHDGARALSVTDTSELRIARGFDALWLLGAAVESGRGGDVERARSLLERSLEQFDRCPGFIGYRHLGLRLAAEAAIEDGWTDPGPRLVEAEQWFRERELPRPAQACRSLAARAGIPQRRPRGQDVPPTLAAMGITNREVDVLGLLAEGLTNREIGRRLYISPRTVKSHVEHLLTKSGAANRAQLAALATPYLDVDTPGNP